MESDREVFRHIGASPDTNLQIDFLTYAIYAHDKHEWAELYRQQSGAYPTEDQERAWISQITPFRFAFYREEAARLFDGAARIYLAAEIDEQRQAAVRQSILGEVKAAGSWWRQLVIALVTAVLAPLIIGLIIVAALWYDHVIFSASDVAHSLGPPRSGSP